MRINISQAFNGIGTVVAPVLGSYVFFLKTADDTQALKNVWFSPPSRTPSSILTFPRILGPMGLSSHSLFCILHGSSVLLVSHTTSCFPFLSPAISNSYTTGLPSRK